MIIIADRQALLKVCALTDEKARKEFVVTKQMNERFSDFLDTRGYTMDETLSDDDVIGFALASGKHMAIVLAEWSAVYSSYISGLPIVAEDRATRKMAKRYGCQCYYVEEYIKMIKEEVYMER